MLRWIEQRRRFVKHCFSILRRIYLPKSAICARIISHDSIMGSLRYSGGREKGSRRPGFIVYITKGKRVKKLDDYPRLIFQVIAILIMRSFHTLPPSVNRPIESECCTKIIGTRHFSWVHPSPCRGLQLERMSWWSAWQRKGALPFCLVLKVRVHLNLVLGERVPGFW